MRTMLAVAALAVCCGCARYFKVTEPNGAGKTYYTTQIQDTSSGAIKFKDLRTGASVTMAQSEVKEVRAGDLPDDLKPKK